MGAVRESIYPQIAENSTVRKGVFHLNPFDRSGTVRKE